MKQGLIKGLMFSLTMIVMVTACRKKDAPLPDNLVQFESNEQGIAETETTKTIKIKLTRATNIDIPVSISLTPSAGLDYTTDYTTTPTAVGGNATVTILSGSSEASLVINKTAGALFYGDEKIVLKIVSSASPVIIGTLSEMTVNFAEIISVGTTIEGDGGGATYGNKVFFDLSANSQTGVQRTKWDLGFYSGDDFRVILNSSTAMMAKQLSKTDMNAVTAADTVGFSTDVVFSQFAPTAASLAYIDYPTGDLTKTAIAAISATTDENKVYIVNRGTGIGSPAPARGWKKIRILRNASGGYTLQHADIAATTFTSVDIAKDVNYFFKYISFENGAVEVEPAAKKWDIAWTFFSNMTTTSVLNPITNLMEMVVVPYTFQDMIILNRNVQVDTVRTTTKAYADFGEADLASLTFISSQTGIGADWRSGGGPGTAPFVRTDRYYVIKDGDGNYYKIRFTAMTKNGERGYPAFEFALVKKG